MKAHKANMKGNKGPQGQKAWSAVLAFAVLRWCAVLAFGVLTVARAGLLLQLWSWWFYARTVQAQGTQKGCTRWFAASALELMIVCTSWWYSLDSCAFCCRTFSRQRKWSLWTHECPRETTMAKPNKVNTCAYIVALGTLMWLWTHDQTGHGPTGKRKIIHTPHEHG